MTQPLFLGIAALEREHDAIDVGFACHDGTYSIDFEVETLDTKDHNQPPSQGDVIGSESGTGMAAINPEDMAALLADEFIKEVRKYEREHFYRFVSVGITKPLAYLSPQLEPRLWSELDIVPMVFDQALEYLQGKKEQQFTVDEEADSMARKCLMSVSQTTY